MPLIFHCLLGSAAFVQGIKFLVLGLASSAFMCHLLLGFRAD